MKPPPSRSRVLDIAIALLIGVVIGAYHFRGTLIVGGASLLYSLLWRRWHRQFVFADGEVAPDRPGMPDGRCTVFDFEESPHTPGAALRALLAPDPQDPPAFVLTPAGQAALQSIP
jgi:hypothetical protein